MSYGAMGYADEQTERRGLTGKPTIDVELVVVRIPGAEYAINTSNKVAVEPQTETVDPIRLLKGTRLLAQKKGRTVITGNQITITDNVMTFELIKILQGGEITTNDDGGLVYIPPLSGDPFGGTIFELDCYSAVYDEAGEIVEYEKTTFPNCTGDPVAITSEDDNFRLPEYVINSAPRRGQPHTKYDYVKSLPVFDFTPPVTVAAMTIDDQEDTYLPDTLE